MVGAVRKHEVPAVKPNTHHAYCIYIGQFIKYELSRHLYGVTKHVWGVMKQRNDSTGFSNIEHVATNKQVNGYGVMEHHLDKIILPFSKEMFDQLSKMVAGYQNVVFFQTW